MTGSTIVGSEAVRSTNQARPPVCMDTTGALHIPRNPKNMEVKKTAWVSIGSADLMGWQLCSSM